MTPRRALLVPAALATILLVVVVGGTPARADDPAHDPVVRCDYWRQAATIVFAATAYVAQAHVPPKSLTVVCKYTNYFSRYSTSNTAPGPVVNSTSAGPLTASDMTVCGIATATYDDGHVGVGHFGDPGTGCF